MIAHVGALPLEEVLPVLTGAGSGLLAVRAWIAPRLRRRRGVRAVNYPTTVQMERTYSALAPGRVRPVDRSRGVIREGPA
jgi:hypothetical protein